MIEVGPNLKDAIEAFVPVLALIAFFWAVSR